MPHVAHSFEGWRNQSSQSGQNSIWALCPVSIYRNTLFQAMSYELFIFSAKQLILHCFTSNSFVQLVPIKNLQFEDRFHFDTFQFSETHSTLVSSPHVHILLTHLYFCRCIMSRLLILLFKFVLVPFLIFVFARSWGHLGATSHQEQIRSTPMHRSIGVL